MTTSSTYNKLCAGILTKEYLPGAKAFFKSLLHHNNKFNLPFIIFFNEPDVEKDFESLQQIYGNIIFKQIDIKEYENFSCNNAYRVWDYNPYTRIEIFKLNANQLFFFDFDIIINGSLEDFFKIQTDFSAATIPYNLYSHICSKKNYFNAGIMIIGKKHLCSHTFDSLYEMCKQKKWPGNESLLNEFIGETFDILDKAYNTLTVEKIHDMDSIRILQYVGHKKPWNTGNILAKMDKQVFIANGPVTAATLLEKFNKFN